MLQRFALIWPAMCLLSMGAHVFVAPSVPVAAGMVATAIAIMPIAVLASLAQRVLSYAIGAASAQLIAHVTLHVGSLSFHSQHAEHGGGLIRSAVTPYASAVAESPAAVGHTLSLGMLVAHIVCGVLLAVALARVDSFISTCCSVIRRLFQLPSLRLSVATCRSSALNSTVWQPRRQMWAFSVSLRGPPVPFVAL